MSDQPVDPAVSEYMSVLGKKMTRKKRKSCEANVAKASAALAQKWKDPDFRRRMSRKSRAAWRKRKPGTKTA